MEELAIQAERMEHQRRSREGEAKRDDVQELLAHWSNFVGVPHAMLVRQMPQFFLEWGYERMHDAIEAVALNVRLERERGFRLDSWEAFRLLVTQLREWRKAAR